jgi:hypothetical protein
MALSNGIPIETVRAMFGKSFKTAQINTKVVQEKMASLH